MNLLREHLTLVIFSSIMCYIPIWNIYIALAMSITYVTFIFYLIYNNTSRKYEYITTSLISLIFFYAGIDLIFKKNYTHLQLILYTMSLCYFHFMEYAFNLVFHPKTVNFDSNNYKQ
jgi:hypothetical protein